VAVGNRLPFLNSALDWSKRSASRFDHFRPK